MNYQHLPFDLEFCFRFNLHKLAGFLIEDDDLGKICRMYNVAEKELCRIHQSLERSIETAAGDLVQSLDYLPPKSELTLLALGDSITSDRLSYAKLIGHIWKKSGRTVIDAGISGDTTSDLINRHYAGALELDFSAVTIFIGTNDARSHDDGYGITNTSVPEFRRNYEYLLQTLKEKTARVFTVTIPPVHHQRFAEFFPEEDHYLYRDETIQEINTVIRDLSSKHKALCIDFAEQIQTSGIDVIDVDGLHLSLEGHKLLAGLLLEVLK